MEGVLCEYTAVDVAFSQFINRLTDIQDSAQLNWTQFKQHRANLERNIAQHVTAGSSHKKVSLDIGGTNFNTTEETLLKQKDTFFWAMLRSGEWQPDSTGQYFIDRSPHMFGVILDYLRDGQVREGLSEASKRTLQTELDFYQVSIPHLEPFQWDTKSYNGDPTTCQIGLHTIMALTTCTLRSLATTQFGPGTTVFTLDILGSYTAACALLRFGQSFILDLAEGKASHQNGGVWVDALPPLATDTGAVKKYKFVMNSTTSQLEIEWPTGETFTKVFTAAPPHATLFFGRAKATAFQLGMQ